jgi:hypothetical protein
MKSAYRITGLYALFSALWIILSDNLLSLLFKDPVALTTAASAKGLLFVVVTSVLLFLMIKRELVMKNKVIVQLDREVEIREQLIRELHHRIKNNLQVVIGLMNIETMDREFSREVKERISNKLLSMMSVFNIVYDLRDMKSVSFQSVLGEYRRISLRNIAIGKIDPGISYSIEVIITCLLLIDSLIEVFLGSNSSVTTAIASETPGLVELRFASAGQKLNEPDDKDLAFLELQAKSLDGKLEMESGESLVRIRFSRFE